MAGNVRGDGSRFRLQPVIAGFIALIWLPLLPTAARAEGGPVATTGSPRYYVPEVPADIGPVEFYLMTIGLGDDIASRFGHTGIRIKNPAEGTDVVFNWGKFYFDQPDFLWKFFRGELTYSMGVRTYQGDVLHYLQSGQRLTMDKLNLTLRQKRRLMEKIAWNAVPENRDFPYQYWYKNCSTIPRDYIDEVVEGQIRARYFAQPTNVVFRDYVRTNLAREPFVAPMLDIFMNSNIDRPITAWEEMFLPGKLRDQLLAMPAVDDEGNPVAGTHLLSDTEVLLDNPEVMAPLFNDYAALMAPTAISLLAALGMLLKRRAPGVLPRPAAYRLLGISAVTWGLVSGVLGLTLLLNWAFSGHPDGWHNVNLLLFWPVDFLFIPIGVALIRQGQRVKDRYLFLYSGQVLALGHLVALGLLCTLAAGHIVAQDVWRVVGWFGVPAAALAISLEVYGFGARVFSAASQRSEAAAPVPKAKLKPAR